MKEKNKSDKVLDSLYNSIIALYALIRTMYKKMSSLIIVFTLVSIFLIEKFCDNTTVQLRTLTFVILISTIAVYVKSKNYGEAVLALSSGLFTIYTVTWNKSLFISFIVVWVLFTIIVFLTMSIRISTKVEATYMEAMFASDYLNLSKKEFNKKMQELASSINNSIIGPIEIAEIIRTFTYRKLTYNQMQIGLKWVNIFYSIIKIEYLSLADFVSDVLKYSAILNSELSLTDDQIFNHIYQSMRESPVCPKDFLNIFKENRHHLIKSKNIILYCKTINAYFSNGISSSKVEEFFEDSIKTQKL